MCLCGIIRMMGCSVCSTEYKLKHALHGRNDVAVEKAQALARAHGVKTSAYRVDSRCCLVLLLGIGWVANWAQYLMPTRSGIPWRVWCRSMGSSMSLSRMPVCINCIHDKLDWTRLD